MILYWKVVDLQGHVLYENNSIKLCQHWRKANNLVSKTFIRSQR